MDEPLDPHTSAVDRVIVVPRNGYINRLQAWASAQGIADHLGARLSVVWETEEVAPTNPRQLFDPSLVDEAFISSEDLTRICGVHHADLPRYLTMLADRGLVVLAGHDKGEQHFMKQLRATIRSNRPHTVVLIAGGHFQISDVHAGVADRCDFYRALLWSEELESRFAVLMAERPPFLGLHIRATDRSATAPFDGAIEGCLRRFLSTRPERHLFIASDTDAGCRNWVARARSIGFQPWTQERINRNRLDEGAGLDALLDWRILGHAHSLAYPAASSYGHEAAVATGRLEDCIGLAAPRWLETARNVTHRLRSVPGFRALSG